MQYTKQLSDNRQEIYRELADVNGLTLIKLNGKDPFEKRWPTIEHRNFDELNFKETDNAGIITGSVNGLIVLDIDNEELFTKALAENAWDLPETYTVLTGSGGGHHYYFVYPEDGNDYRGGSKTEVGIRYTGKWWAGGFPWFYSS